MKRFLVIPLMLLYLLAASGLRINMHFCGSSLSSWTLFADAEDCYCEKSKKKKAKKHDCCSEEVVLAKMEQDHQGVSGLHFGPHPIDALLPLPLYSCGNDAVHVLAGRSTIAHRPNAPPGPWQQIPLYKLYQRFTYYG